MKYYIIYIIFIIAVTNNSNTGKKTMTSITKVDGCEWNKNVTSCQCGPDTTLHLASNMKKYCLVHYRIIEYVLVACNATPGNDKENKRRLSKSDSNITRNVSAKNLLKASTDRSSDSESGGSGSSGRSTPLTSLVMEKVCHAKECDSKDVKVVYQGMFCEKHEKLVKSYRDIIELNKRDEYELYVREMEQNLRKVPHPLFQKQIVTLNMEVRKKEADYINFVFSSPPYSLVTTTRVGGYGNR